MSRSLRRAGLRCLTGLFGPMEIKNGESDTKTLDVTGHNRAVLSSQNDRLTLWTCGQQVDMSMIF
jgi:hypothetical protein